MATLEQQWLQLSGGVESVDTVRILSHIVNQSDEWVSRQADEIVNYIVQLQPDKRRPVLGNARGHVLAKLLERSVVPPDHPGFMEGRPVERLLNILLWGYGDESDVSNILRLIQLGHKAPHPISYGDFNRAMAKRPVRGWPKILTAISTGVGHVFDLGSYLIKQHGSDHIIIWSLAHRYPLLLAPDFAQSLSAPSQAALRTVVGSDLQKYILRAV